MGTETILLVEDDTTIRKLTSKVLKLNGYKVLEASRASEAIEICKTFHEPIDLIISDVVMPDLSGPKMVAQLQQQGLQTRIIYISGYTQGLLTNQNTLEPRAILIQKPFTATTLLNEIRQVLHSSHINH
jgi:DNA-binding NtrC family response regulator